MANRSEIKFVMNGSVWDSKHDYLEITNNAVQPIHILQLRSQDRYGYMFDLMEILRSFNMVSRWPSYTEAWRSQVVAALTKLGFYRLLDIQIVESKLNSSKITQFMYEESGHVFALSYVEYAIKTVTARCSREHSTVVFQLPIREDGYVDEKVLIDLGLEVQRTNDYEVGFPKNDSFSSPGGRTTGNQVYATSLTDESKEVRFQVLSQPKVGAEFNWYETYGEHAYYKIISIE